ncbi:MAG: Nif3-like dinuclear metal center hexameric protein [Tepidisphaerales bacterium]
MSILLSQLIETMETIAPTRHAESWDNVGLLAGDPQQAISRAIVCIDYTAEVAAEGQRLGCDAVIAYHPVIFEGLKRVTAGSVVFDALRRGLPIYSPHTAWDVAPGGVNDFLMDILGVSGRRALRPAAAKATACKLVVFTPAEAIEKVSQAMFGAGAGRIGNYSGCSFRAPGTGTFFGEEGANPAVGQAGRFEQVEELRLETIVPLANLERVVAAMRAAHPYEEPAFDIIPLQPPPDGLGQGRIGRFDAPVERRELLQRIRKGLGLSQLLVAGPVDGTVSSVACLAGAGGEHLKDALEQQAGLYLTGEIRHHDALKAAQRGMTVVCTLHSNSERASLSRLADRVRERLPGLELRLSAADRDPFAVIG